MRQTMRQRWRRRLQRGRRLAPVAALLWLAALALQGYARADLQRALAAAWSLCAM